MNLKELALVKTMQSFENIGFMEWHARVLSVAEVKPKTIRKIAQETGLFQYHVRGVVQDLIGLQLVEYTRNGIQIGGDFDMLLQLVSICEGENCRKSFDYEAAFEVVAPRVLSLKKRFGFEV
jgi:predicted transcriptional regulator